MRDSIGGIFNVGFIAIFLVIVSGYLAFSVSYNKAFKVKNKIISTIEQYQGYNRTTKEVIDDYIQKIGYNHKEDINVQNAPGVSCGCDNGYCIFWIEDTEAREAGIPKGYFKVVTAVDISIPVLEKFLPNMKIFQTSGDTMTINTTYGCAG